MISQKTRGIFSPTLVVLMTIFIDVTGFGIILPLLPFYTAVFQAGSTALGVLVASFALMQFISSPILGRFSDRVGRRPVLLLSILTSVASFILFALAKSFLILLFSRIVAGLATEVGVAQAYISDITSETERAAGMGRVGAAFGAGFIIGPALGGFLSVYGFSAAGFAAAFLAFINLMFAFFFLPESRTHEKQLNETWEDSSLLADIVNAVSKPLMGSILVIIFVMSLASSAFPVIMPLLAISFFGLSSSDMSIFFVFFGFLQILLQGLVIGRLATKFGEANLIALGAVLMTVGLFFLAAFPTLTLFIVLTAVMISGSGILQTAIPSFVSKRTSTDERGGVLGIIQSIASIARVPGPLIGGLVFDVAGAVAPFFLSAFLLLVPTVLGLRVATHSRKQENT